MDGASYSRMALLTSSPVSRTPARLLPLQSWTLFYLHLWPCLIAENEFTWSNQQMRYTVWLYTCSTFGMKRIRVSAKTNLFEREKEQESRRMERQKQERSWWSQQARESYFNQSQWKFGTSWGWTESSPWFSSRIHINDCQGQYWQNQLARSKEQWRWWLGEEGHGIFTYPVCQFQGNGRTRGKLLWVEQSLPLLSHSWSPFIRPTANRMSFGPVQNKFVLRPEISP